MKADKNDPIKIATSTGKDVILYPNGTVQCGRVTYRPRRHAQEFRDIYSFIDHYLRRYRIAKRDVGGPIRILTIEDLAQYMAEKWQASITVRRVQRLQTLNSRGLSGWSPWVRLRDHAGPDFHDIDRPS